MTKSKRHDLAIPDRAYALQALERHLDSMEAEQLWIKLCKKCGYQPYTDELSELEEVYRCMSKQGGKVGVTGSSLVVRMMSYNLLKK